MASQQGVQIDLTQVPIPQLNEISQKIEAEYNFIINSIQQLKTLQQQFSKSKECLEAFKPETKEKEILLPLTSTLYIPGHLSDTEHVMIDIGTGYYVDMKIKQADAYFARRVEYIDKQVEKIKPVLDEKAHVRQAVTEVLQKKVQAAIVAQQKPGSTSTGGTKLSKVTEEVD